MLPACAAAAVRSEFIPRRPDAAAGYLDQQLVLPPGSLCRVFGTVDFADLLPEFRLILLA